MKRNILLSIILLATLIGCTKKEKTESTQKEKIIPITIVKSVEKEYTPLLQNSGTAFANKEANLGTTIPGRVEKIFFHKGKTVKKNELLVQLSNELYSQALIERNTLEKDFNRVARLHEKESISVQDYDHIKAKYEASKAKTKMLRKNSEIRAPFSGTIVDYLVLEGENFFFAPSLKAGYSHTSGIVQLMQLDILKVEIAVNEKEISKIKKGQIAQIKFDAYPQDKYKGIVKTINPILSTLTRTAKVELEINNSKRKIKPGMYANVNIELQKRKAIFIPLKAIYRLPGTGNDYVFVINNKIAKRVAIEKFETIGNLVAVKGIKKNVEIALAGKNKLRNLSKVSF